MQPNEIKFLKNYLSDKTRVEFTYRVDRDQAPLIREKNGQEYTTNKINFYLVREGLNKNDKVVGAFFQKKYKNLRNKLESMVNNCFNEIGVEKMDWIIKNEKGKEFHRGIYESSNSVETAL